MRVVGRIDSSAGQVSINPFLLGLGPLVLQPIGILPSDPEELVWGPPLRLVISPSPPQAGWPLTMSSLWKPGLRLSWGQGQNQTVSQPIVQTIDRTDNPQWLAAAGVAPTDVFCLDGFFNLDETGLCQFQIKSNMALTLSLDGEVLLLPVFSSWRFIPLHLKNGIHRIQIWARAAANPQLELRYGQRGSSPLDGQNFRHIPPPEKNHEA